MSLSNTPLHRVGALALAALAIIAVAGMLLLAAGGPASAGTTPLDDGDYRPVLQEDEPTATPTPTPTPTPGPRHAAPEACPGEPGNSNALKHVVDSGHYALFDVWWNPDEGELTNNVCPPSITDSGDRAPSGINIEAVPPTIIHIPSSAKVDLSTSTTYTEAKYKDVWDADNKENRDTDNDGTPDGVGDRMVWALPACPASGSLTASDLCISFSAALLRSEDWNGTIDYLVNHVHQIDIDKQDPRYVLVYDVPKVDDVPPYKPRWNSSDARRSKVSVAPGGYDRPMWFFTDRGAYEFQVHIQGYPDTSEINPTSGDGSVTSDVREYILHVGAEADLGVAMTVTPDSPSPGDDVTITIAASSAGPDEVPSAEVDVTLPVGLTYSSHTPASADFEEIDDDNDDNDPIWKWDIGSLASGASETLTITASVDAETHGKALDVKAAISATEPLTITETELDPETGQPVVDEAGEPVKVLNTYHVPVPDQNPDNDMDAEPITVASEANVDPMFQFTRSLSEDSSAGDSVGDPIRVYDPNNGDTLSYSLSGTDSDHFEIDSSGAISIATGKRIDYECRKRYDLRVHVSDGKDEFGNDDPSIDDTNALVIDIEEDTSKDSAERLDALVRYTVDPSMGPFNSTPASLNTEVTISASDRSLTYTCPGSWRYVWKERINGVFVQMENVSESDDEITVTSDVAQTRVFFITPSFIPDGNPDAEFVVNGGLSEEISVTWE